MAQDVQKLQDIKKHYITYVISLKYPEKLLNTLSRHSLTPILFKGFLGKETSQNFITKHFTTLYSIFGPKSSIGCALSHLHVWKTFLNTNKKYAIVFEDDIILDSQTPHLLPTIHTYISNTPRNFDILYLGCFGSENTPNFFTIIMKLLGISSQYKYINTHVKKPEIALAAHAYIISRKGAKKLIKHLNNNIHNHIDYCIQALYAKGILNNYVTIPRLIYQSSTDTTMSNNVSNLYPILLNNILSDFYVDKHVKASYITTLSVFRLGNTNFTISTILLVGIIITSILLNVNYYYILLWIFLISLPNFISNTSQ
jgi:GR25 family glycosyltransferase involved in LPS biosynthesis